MLTGLQRRYVVSNFKGNYIHKLSTMLQKGRSENLKDDSNDEGQSDVSLFHIDDFKPHFATEFQWTY